MRCNAVASPVTPDKGKPQLRRHLWMSRKGFAYRYRRIDIDIATHKQNMRMHDTAPTIATCQQEAKTERPKPPARKSPGILLRDLHVLRKPAAGSQPTLLRSPLSLPCQRLAHRWQAAMPHGNTKSWLACSSLVITAVVGALSTNYVVRVTAKILNPYITAKKISYTNFK